MGAASLKGISCNTNWPNLRLIRTRKRRGNPVRCLRSYRGRLRWRAGAASIGPRFGAGGVPRRAAAEQTGMARDWVHRYNNDGVTGLRSIRIGGRAPALSQTQMAEFKELTVKGLDPAKDGVVRWRCLDLRAAVQRHGNRTNDWKMAAWIGMNPGDPSARASFTPTTGRSPAPCNPPPE